LNFHFRNEQDTYRIVYAGKNGEMWNEVFRDHANRNPSCQGEITWDPQSERQQGLCWIETAKCNTCEYKSKPYKLYAEVRTGKSGPMAAAPNQALQIALAQSPIGNESFRKTLLSTGIPAPSHTSMLKTGQRVQKVIEEANKQDMKDRIEQLKDISEIRGGSRSDPIAVECDAGYSNPLYSQVGKNPFQPATQAWFSVVENQTRSRDIIDINPRSKLCSRGAKARKICPDHPGPCTANMRMDESIGNEQAMAKDSLSRLIGEGIEVEEIVTDPDSSTFRAAEELYAEDKSSTRPKHYIDIRHLSRNQRKLVNRTSFSSNFFTGSTKKARDSMQGLFANDLAVRCEAEYQRAMRKHGGDINLVKRGLSYTVYALEKCYQGDHTDCRKHSYCCKGKKSDNWMIQSCHIPSTFSVKCDNNDIIQLRKCIQYRLGHKILDLTAKNRDTQKAEAINRGIRRSLPRNVTFQRSFVGRLHSAVHAINNNQAASLMILCKKSGCPIKEGTRVARAFYQMQRQVLQRKIYNKSAKCRLQKARKRRYLYSLHASVASKGKIVTGYKKAMLLKHIQDHNYSKK